MKKELIYLIFQFVLFALFFIDYTDNSAKLPFWATYLSIGLMVLGIVIIFLGILSLRGFFSSISKSKGLSQGLYAYVRHPVYFGIILAMLGYALFNFSLIKFLVTLSMGFLLYFKSNLEEQFIQKMDRGYAEYKKRTGRFFPKKRNHDSQ